MADLQARYNMLCQRQDFEADPAQQQALSALADVTVRISKTARLFHKSPPARGLWLWGPVGRGKTLLMDLFFESLSESKKQRLHFHHFMRRLHQDLNRLSGHPDPLSLVAKQLTHCTHVLCFDEFFVSDIADAMLLGRLFEQLFARGMFLVATSNQHPDQLYPDGLQRQRFLHTIELLKQHCHIHAIDGTTDHRLRQLQQARLFLDASNADTERLLQQHFAQFSTTEGQQQTLQILGRPIPCRLWSQNSVWFSFSALCEGPRSHLDYIDIAERFSCLILSDIPSLDSTNETFWVVQGTEDRLASATNQRQFLGRNDDIARRFISLIDELYDRSVVLIASADVSIDNLYPSGPLEFAFARTRSRLREMQSRLYLQHRFPNL